MGGMGNMNNLIKQAQKMQAEAMRVQKEIAEKEFETAAGGGAVTVKLTGEKILTSLKINPDVVDPDDVEMLEDLVMAAVNEGLRTVEEYTSSKMKAVTGGMPGMF